MSYSKDTFCVLPFVFLSNTNGGDYRTCCEAFSFGTSMSSTSPTEVWNSDFYRNLRLDLKNGTRNKNCDSCWNVENSGGYSTRQSENAQYSNDDIKNMLSHMYEDGFYSKYPLYFEFKLGNLCNLKCIMCTQIDSSQHESEIKTMRKQGEIVPRTLDYIDSNLKEPHEIFRLDNQTIDELIENFSLILPHIKNLKLVGGEPLINPLTELVLDTAVDSGFHKNIEIEMITNLSQINNKVFDKIEKFKTVRLSCSYDHIDKDKFNYIRYPAKLENFQNNFEKVLLNEKILLQISTTFSIFNIFDLYKIFTKFNQDTKQRQSLPVCFNFVTEPRYFCIQYLEYTQKQEIVYLIQRVLQDFSKERILKENPDMVSYLKNAKDWVLETPHDYQTVRTEMKRVLELYDKMRKTNFRKIFPRLGF